MGVFDRKELVVVLRAGLWSERAPPAVHKIPRRQRAAVAPFGIRPQVECVGSAIRRDLPALRDTRHSLSILILGTESFKEGIDYTPLWLAGDDRWVERLRFGAIDENQVCPLAAVPATRQGEPKNCHANPVSGA